MATRFWKARVRCIGMQAVSLQRPLRAEIAHPGNGRFAANGGQFVFEAIVDLGPKFPV